MSGLLERLAAILRRLADWLDDRAGDAQDGGIAVVLTELHEPGYRLLKRVKAQAKRDTRGWTVWNSWTVGNGPTLDEAMADFGRKVCEYYRIYMDIFDEMGPTLANCVLVDIGEVRRHIIEVKG